MLRTSLVVSSLMFGAILHALTLDIRLLTPVSTRTSRLGSEIRAVVIAPAGGVAAGSMVHGKITQVRRVGLGFVHETARVRLAFDELRLADGTIIPVESQITAVDNARERVDRRGAIRGSRATASVSHRMAGKLVNLAMHHPYIFIPALVVQTALIRFPEPEIEFPAGTDMRIAVDGEIPVAAAVTRTEFDPKLDAALKDIVAKTPYWSYFEGQKDVSDVVNLVFVGSRDALERAFVAAGWSGADPMSPTNRYRVVRAIVENRPYRDAPMRRLLLDGTGPDMEWQKSLNTFSKRHHLRVWSRGGDWNGTPVWLSAATHDISITFSLHQGFTHRIHDDVDLEREKVVNDLRLTGCVDAVTRIGRPELVDVDEERERRSVRTDGAVAAVMLNSCENPVATEATPDPVPPHIAKRIIRRINLSLRNQYLRNNWPWKLAEGGRYGYRMVRSLRHGVPKPPALALRRSEGSRSVPGGN
jgi:hypothetical protein